MAARDHFAMRATPDQSILVLDSDTSGQWPLVRVRKWWAENPVQEVLNVPGWSAADAKHMAQIYVDVQVTPDGHYAIAFSGAVWQEKSDFLFHAARGYVPRRPDTIITVVDLERWQIVSSLHTASIGSVRLRNARIVSSKWIGFDGEMDAPPAEHGLYSHLEKLLSIPDLRPGPECVAQRFSHLWPAVPDALIHSVQDRNDTACRELLSATGRNSTEELEVLMERGSGVEPTALKLRDVQWHEDLLKHESHRVLSEKVRLWDADQEASQFFRHWGEYPYFDFYWQNPPFESSSHKWYGLYPAREHGFYELDRYDANGELQASETARHLLCGDPALGNLKSACGCRVVDVSEEQRALLAYCRHQRGDFDGTWQKQWLSVLRPDDLSEVELIELPRDRETLQALARGDGHAYVVTLEFGETLHVYAIPDAAMRTPYQTKRSEVPNSRRESGQH